MSDADVTVVVKDARTFTTFISVHEHIYVCEKFTREKMCSS